MQASIRRNNGNIEFSNIPAILKIVVNVFLLIFKSLIDSKLFNKTSSDISLYYINLVHLFDLINTLFKFDSNIYRIALYISYNYGNITSVIDIR